VVAAAPDFALAQDRYVEIVRRMRAAGARRDALEDTRERDFVTRSRAVLASLDAGKWKGAADAKKIKTYPDSKRFKDAERRIQEMIGMAKQEEHEAHKTRRAPCPKGGALPRSPSRPSRSWAAGARAETRVAVLEFTNASTERCS
jgi:hypothetical protein